MKRINFPLKASSALLNNFINAYKAIYTASELTAMQDAWANWKKNYGVTTIPETVDELLAADMDTIADLYERFVALGIPVRIKVTKSGKNETIRNPKLKELDNIFKYDRKYDSRIADFFCKHAVDLQISTCHYCELSYVNTYSRYTKGKVKSIQRHFDVDHYLPKSKCPIIGLSLFNFVPSCQVCNSRIKGQNLIGPNKADWIKFSPTSETFDFDNNVEIKLRMHRGPSTAFKIKGEYYIHFRSKNGFQAYVDFFHLEERYEFHKPEALRLKKLKAQYPASARKKIASLLKTSEKRVKEDIFHKNFLKNNNRCFSKLTKDILK